MAEVDQYRFEQKHSCETAGWGWVTVSLFVLLAVYVGLIVGGYVFKPMFSDSLWYVEVVNDPQKASMKLFFRHFNYYAAKLLTSPCPTVLAGCAMFSVLMHGVVIAMSFLIVNTLGERRDAFLAAIVIMMCPPMILEATQYGPDAPCLAFGLTSLWLAVSASGKSKWPKVKLFGAGFFLVGAVYSKLTGICFVLPILINIRIYKRPNKWAFLGVGLLTGFCFLMMGDWIWRNDAFYHLNPMNYGCYFGRFGDSLVDAIQKGGGVWRRTFADAILEYPYVQYFVFLTASVVLLTSKFPSRSSVRFWCLISIMAVWVGSLFLHEGVHVRDSILKIHDRWVYTVFVPIGIMFWASLGGSFVKRSADKNQQRLRIHAICDMVFMGIVLIFCVGARYAAGFHGENTGGWSFYKGIVNVLSVWILLAGLGVLVLFRNLESGSNICSRILMFRFCGYVGALAIIWYCATWCFVEANKERRDLIAHYHDTVGQVRDFVDKAGKRILIAGANVKTDKVLEDGLKYCFLDGLLSSDEYELALDSTANPLEFIDGNRFDGVLTAIDISDHNPSLESKGIHLVEKGKLLGRPYYEIVKVEIP